MARIQISYNNGIAFAREVTDSEPGIDVDDGDWREYLDHLETHRSWQDWLDDLTRSQLDNGEGDYRHYQAGYAHAAGYPD